ncbi:MAG: hypothetical protein C0622_08355 [Desulfuromonas sp.]|nr:MAG: hypothetical protein C0622_08355 [Desulfuromonas sp.]
MLKFTRWLLILVLLLSACAPLRPVFEPPTVQVTSFRVVQTSDVVPSFEIGLHVINPNRMELNLEGLTYQVELEGHRILSGATNKLPVIAAYGEGDILLEARPDLLNTLSLFSDLIRQPRDRFAYRLDADLDIGGLWPNIPISKQGNVLLRGAK